MRPRISALKVHGQVVIFPSDSACGIVLLGAGGRPGLDRVSGLPLSLSSRLEATDRCDQSHGHAREAHFKRKHKTIARDVAYGLPLPTGAERAGKPASLPKPYPQRALTSRTLKNALTFSTD